MWKICDFYCDKAIDTTNFIIAIFTLIAKEYDSF